MNKFLVAVWLLLTLDGMAEESRWHNLMVRDAWERDQQLQGGDGTQVPRLLEYAPDGETVFMGVDTAGVYRSDDGGRSWMSKMVGIEGYFIKGLAVDPGDPNCIYALADAHPAFDSPVKGLYRSEDNGEHWEMVQKFNLQGLSGDGNLNMVKLFPDSYSAEQNRCSDLLVGTGAGLFVSTNGAASFSQTAMDSIGVQVITAIGVLPSDNQVVYAGTENGVYRSADCGRTFILCDDGLPEKAAVIDLAMEPGSERIYAIINKKELYVKEGVAPWVNLIPSESPILGKKSRGRMYAVRVHPAAPNRVMLGIQWNYPAGSPYYSEDYGKTWVRRDTKTPAERFNVGSHHEKANTVIFPPLAFAPHSTNPDVWLKAFNFGSIFRTENAGETWEWSNTNYGGLRGLQLVVNPNNANHFIINTVDMGPLVTFDGGLSFERASAERYHKVDALHGIILPGADSPETATVIEGIGKHNPTLPGVLEISRDGGRNFTIIPGTEGNQKAAIFTHPLDSNYIYAGDVFSRDGGQSWTKISAPDGAQIIAAAPDNKDMVYLFNGSQLFLSRDNGLSCELLKDLGYTGPFPKAFITAAKLTPDGQTFVIGHDGGIYVYNMVSDVLEFKTENDGLVRNSSGRLDMKRILIDPENPNVIYAGEFSLIGGTASWVFKSTDGGQNWNSMMTDDVFGNRRVWGLGLDLHGILWAFTDHSPFWYGQMGCPAKVAQLNAGVENGLPKLYWGAVNGAYTYQVRRSLAPSGPFEVIQGGVSGTSFVDQTPLRGEPVYYTVSAANLAGEGSASEPAPITVK